MASVLSRLRGQPNADQQARASIDEFLSWFTYNNAQYPLHLQQQTMPGSPAVPINDNFAGYVQSVHRRSGIVAAAVTARALLISQLRFRWRALDDTEGRLFGTSALSIVENPAPDMSRPRLLTVAEQHNSYAGNAYFHRTPDNRLRLLNPQWVDVLIGSNTDPEHPGWELDAEVVGYAYHPGGKQSGRVEVLGLEEVAHWMPEPDPVCWWRGESWVTSVIREIQTDGQATDHQSKFYENAATPQIIFTLDSKTTQAQANEVAKVIHEKHAGVENAYRNLVVGGGASPTVVGSDLAQLSLRDSQGGHETRISVRSRVPAPVLGIREGNQGAALNAGNYVQIRRLWSDTWYSPFADTLCADLQRICTPVPGGAELVYDPSRISFLQEDRKDEADIRAQDAETAQKLYSAGYVPDTITEFLRTSGDWSVLKHTQRPSVQTTEGGATGSPNGQTPSPQGAS